MHELYGLLAIWRPVALVGFASLVVMVLVARTGNQGGVLEVAVAAVPVVLLGVIVSDRRRPTVAIAGTLLGIYWIGFAFAHAELLRELPHGNGVFIDVLVGTFVGDTAAYAGGRLFGRRPLAPSVSPNKTVEGLFCGMLLAILAVFLAGLYQTWLTQGNALLLGVAVAVIGPLGDLFESRGQAGRRASRTRAACSGRTAARSTAWTPRCSRSSSASTSGRPSGTDPCVNPAGKPRAGRPRLDAVPRRLAILGSTGSIGCQALDVVSRSPELTVVALSAASSWEPLLDAGPALTAWRRSRWPIPTPPRGRARPGPGETCSPAPTASCG